MDPKVQSTLSFLFALLLGMFLVGCEETDPFSVTEADMVSKMKTNKNYDEVVEYGRSIGLDVDTSLYSKEGLFKYLEELGYGHRPNHIRHMMGKVPADTTAIKLAGWDLARGKKVEDVIKKLEPPYAAFHQLKEHYRRLAKTGKLDSAAAVAETMNAYRWMYRQSRGADRLVFVNIRGAYLKGLDSTGKERLRMNVIVGKTGSKTPGLDTYATNVITYPYWNIPKSIALDEMLPRIRQNVYYLERNGIEVLDRRGQVVSPHDIDWFSIDEGNFPYRFRQETGEDNSLGFMKVNIENPYAIYLHDTNVRSLFDNEERWRSHGCVRLQDPAALANFIAGERLLEPDFIEKALAEPDVEREPQVNKLDEKVPTFLYYLPADVDKEGRLIFYEDVYDLDRAIS